METYTESLKSFKEILREQGIDQKVLDAKVGRFPGLIGKNFDLDANNGQMFQILREMSKQPER